MILPKNYLLVSGIGVDVSQLVSFDKALFNAGIPNYNLVRVSSILPPYCSFSDKISAKVGSILFAAYSTKFQDKYRTISSAVGVGIPKDPSNVGVIMEYSCDESVSISEKNVRTMVTNSMEFRNIDLAEIKISSVEAMGKEGVFTTVISALVMW
jgi:arginine decarboxylase